MGHTVLTNTYKGTYICVATKEYWYILERKAMILHHKMATENRFWVKFDQQPETRR